MDQIQDTDSEKARNNNFSGHRIEVLNKFTIISEIQDKIMWRNIWKNNHQC